MEKVIGYFAFVSRSGRVNGWPADAPLMGTQSLGAKKITLHLNHVITSLRLKTFKIRVNDLLLLLQAISVLPYGCATETKKQTGTGGWL